MTDDDNAESNKSSGLNSHRPTEVDEIGFDTYSSALATLLSHSSTETPQTVSVEGVWGSGKSSFMAQLEEKVSQRNFVTIYFNPWKYEDRNDLWSSFMQEFLHQVKDSHDMSFTRRFNMAIKLIKLRAENKDSNLYRLILTLITTLLISIIALVSLNVILGPYLNEVTQIAPIWQNIIIGSTSGVVVLSATLSILSQLRTSVFEPLISSIQINTPDYQENESFLTEVNRDFSRILETYCGGDRVFVFIDDLDRCEVERTAELVKYINLIKEGRSNLVFVVGMDRNTVAAAINSKHEELLPYLRNSGTVKNTEQKAEQIRKPDSSELSNIDKYTSFGHEFLDKFITLPFHVPQPKTQEAAALVSEKLSPDDDSSSDNIDIDMGVLSESFQHIDDMVDIIVSALGHNPRKIKKFRSLYQVQVVLASEQSILYDPDSLGEYRDEQVTFEQLAKYVTISIKWPLFSSTIRDNPYVLEEIEEYESDEQDWNTLSTQAKYWDKDSELVNLLLYNIDISDGGNRYRLSSASITKLTKISSQTDQSQSDNLYLSEEVESEELIQIEEEDIPDVSVTSKRIFGVDFTDEVVAKVYDELSRNKNEFLKISKIADSCNISFSAVESALDTLSGQDIVLNELEDMAEVGSSEEASPTSYALKQSEEIVEVIELLSGLRSSQNFKQRLSIFGLFLENPEAILKRSRIQTAVNLSEDTVAHHLIQLRRKGIISNMRRGTTQSGYKLNATSQDANWLFNSYQSSSDR